MSDITKAIYDTMNNDVPLKALLGSFSGAASIFTQVPLPPSFDIAVHGPYVLTTGEPVQTPADTKNSSGRDLLRDIRCYTDLNRSVKDVEAIADKVRDLFHRIAVTVVGFTVIIADVTGPIEADEDDAFGRILTLRWMLEKQ